ncbi:MAG: Rap1a/Tai family immunity protein [Stellaceae bacterium]
MRLFRLLLAGVLVAFALSPAWGQELSGGRSVHDLYQDCAGSPQSQLSCIRFLGGVASTMMLLGDMADARGVAPDAKAALAAMGACPRASGISGGDMRDAFVRWADSHPDASMQPEELGAMRALLAGWPCR